MATSPIMMVHKGSFSTSEGDTFDPRPEVSFASAYACAFCARGTLIIVKCRKRLASHHASDKYFV